MLSLDQKPLHVKYAGLTRNTFLFKKEYRINFEKKQPKIDCSKHKTLDLNYAW